MHQKDAASYQLPSIKGQQCFFLVDLCPAPFSLLSLFNHRNINPLTCVLHIMDMTCKFSNINSVKDTVHGPGHMYHKKFIS